MPPRIARYRRSGLLRRVFLSAFAWSAAPLAGQELLLQRDYPGSGPYECPTLVTLVAPTPDEQARAGQLASDANQAMILGDFERVAALLAQATELDHQSADLAYRRASILEDLDDIDWSIRKFCLSLALGAETVGSFDADLHPPTFS